ncbi:hypothetical protein EAFG_02240 [Escherichia coli H413]|nr:hypothetical protein EAFG_02240 [Escherichia coli H413]
MFLPIDNQHTMDSTYHDCENDREKTIKNHIYCVDNDKKYALP